MAGQLLALIGFVGLCQLSGLADRAITARRVAVRFAALAKPPGTPPGWVFPIVWTVLFTLIGIAGWLVWRRLGGGRALRLWGWQLLVGTVWTPVFFGWGRMGLAFGVIILLLVLILATIRRFARIAPAAAWLMAPYAVWVAYAAYLNAGLWWLNGHSL